ncbi:MAG: cytochrome oxidase small assembly protein [Pseudomonadota bacterium]
MSQDNKPTNGKTALILASIALIFFIGVFARRIWLS